MQFPQIPRIKPTQMNADNANASELISENLRAFKSAGSAGKMFSLCLISLIATFSCLHARAQSYAVTHVSIIPIDREQILPDQTVLIQDGIIRWIGPSSKASIPKQAVRIDGTNKYLLPGLMDMHMHFFYEQGLDKKFLTDEAKLMLSRGITTTRIMCGDPEYLALKDKINKGLTPGPELFVVSPQLVGRWTFRIKLFGNIAATPSEGVALVKRFKQEGYDEIKLTFFLKPDVYDAIIATAAEINIKVTGHVGPDIKLPRALAARQQIEHLDEFIETLLPDTTYNHGISVSGTGIWQKNTAWKTVPFMDESRIPALVAQVRKAGIYVTPTNYFLITCFALGQTDEEIKASPDYAYIPAFLKQDREIGRNRFWQNPPPESDRKRYIDLRFKMTKALYDGGVPLMAGSDGPEWYLAQGFSLHNELEMFVRAGLSNYAALETATINPARYLGIDNRTGTIQVGKEADLLLLDKNPLEDIRNASSIKGIFNRKLWWDEKAVMGMMEEARVIGFQ